MIIPQLHDWSRTSRPRAVTTSGHWIDSDAVAQDLPGAGMPDARPAGAAVAGPDLSQATALLDAATRMHDSGDPHTAVQVIAAEALLLFPCDGVVVLARSRNGPTPVFQLPTAGGGGDLDTAAGLCAQLADRGLLEPGGIADLDSHRPAPFPLADGRDHRLHPDRWRSLLVADLDSPRSIRPSRLLWYATSQDAFTTASGIAGLFARHAGLALRNVNERHHLQRALDGRTLTGQATGIVMTRHHLSATQAFEVIVRCSQNRNIRLRDAAETITCTGDLPT